MSFFFGGDEKGATIAPTAHGLGLVAAQDLKAQDIVFSETPVLSARLSDAFATPAFLARPDVSKIVDALGAVEEKHGHEAEDEAYPEAAKTLIDDLSELHVLERVAKLDAAGAAKVWALEDAFREPRPGDAVAVDGLKSAAGAALNGARGAVVGADGDRLAVELPGGRKSIKGAHLKTLRGVLKTNSLREGDYGVHVFERLSRLNHACGPAANVSTAFVTMPDGDRVCGVVATRDVAAGAELLADYGGAARRHLPGAARRAWLFRNYGFVCACAHCQSGA